MLYYTLILNPSFCCISFNDVIVDLRKASSDLINLYYDNL